MPDYQNYQTYFNGEWVAWKDVMISPEDRGFGVADVVFDIARTFNGTPFALEHHIDRMYRSLKFLRIDCGLTPEEMTQICEEGVRRNEEHREEAGDFTIHPWVTRGMDFDGPPTVCISIKPVNFKKFARDYIDGAHGVIARTRSYSSDMMDPKVKHHNRLNFVLAELEARDVDPEAHPILLDRDGNVTEGHRVQRLHGKGRCAEDGDRPQHPPGHLPEGDDGGGLEAGHPGRGGGPPALRPVHRGRGLLQPDEPAHHARQQAGQPSRRRRVPGAGHPAAAGGPERDGRG